MEEDNLRINKHYNLFKDYTELSQASFPILKGELPSIIFSQVKHLVSQSRLVKEQNFSFLKDNLHNVDTFNYRSFIPNYLLESTFILEYLRSLGAYFASKFSKVNFSDSLQNTKFNKVSYNSVLDYYDIWINFSGKNNQSYPHTHQGDLSGIVFVENTEISDTIFHPEFKFKGSPGEVVIFPSNLQHKVNTNLKDLERVSIAFNLILKK